MNGIRPTLLSCIITLFACGSIFAQESYCKNLGFESGNFTNWVGYTWLYSTDVTSINTPKVQGIVSRRHVIMSDTTAYDINTGYALKKIPAGYSYSARLGDEITSSDANPRCWEQSLRYTMTVDSNNALLVVKFALVMQYASDHTAKVEPRFRFTLFDADGDTIPDCANYDVYSSNKNIKGFNTYIPSSSTSSTGSVSPVEWRDWTTVGINLLSYIGQTITVEFMSADCTGRYHYGYAYFVAECHPLYITVNYCADDSEARLSAPEGFEKYKWMNSSGAVIDTVQILKVTDPVEGASYSCAMSSATGCTVKLQSIIAKYIPKADFSSFMLDCKSNRVQLTNLSSTTHGSLLFNWNFGDGNILTENSPQYTFSTSGLHRVSLILNNPPSACTDTLTKDVESFSPPLVGIAGDSTYCHGLSVFMKAYGAYEYTWNIGSKADSIEVSDPGGEFWLIGRSSTGCISDTIYRIIREEPDWTLQTSGDSILCEGKQIVLSVSGGVSYLWNTGDTANSIVVSDPGNYHIAGANKRGCKKSAVFNLTEHPLPSVNFIISGSPLDIRHNQLTCSIPAQNDVMYAWNMGDGYTGTGSTIQHSYNIDYVNMAYTVILTATTEYNCTDSSARIAEVIPFVPNVFTPNGDGIDDVFMANIEMEVFDRNGLTLYKGNSGWDGRYNGRTADPDTYFYLIRYHDSNLNTQVLKGFVTLIR
jgi:gliding motility-associated-like protein